MVIPVPNKEPNIILSLLFHIIDVFIFYCCFHCRSVNSLCVHRSNDIVVVDSDGVNLFNTSQTNYVDTVAVSYDSGKRIKREI